jgi:CubicO group peptidase (beta-lactamase class C family)
MPVRRIVFLLLLFAIGCASHRNRVLTSLRPAVDVTGRPAVRWSLAERMAQHGIPAVSVAVADKGRIVWVHAAGVPESALFQAASVSKVVAATGTLRLADQGILDLDADVNRYLRSWQVPESELTAREKVTLRRILSHTAGLTVHGFRGYRLDAPMPTLLDVLDGRPPAVNQPVRVDTIPGTATRYSGGGTSVEQLVLTDVTGRPFPELMRDLVLVPAGMRDSTFEQPLPPALAARAARGHDSSGNEIPGGWAIGPEMAAGWLWTTPSDLMRLAIAIDEAHEGRPGAILSRRMATEMLTVQKDQYGLGPVLEGRGRAFRFSHGGNNPGYLAQLTYFPETGQGAAILVNSNAGELLIDEILRGIAAEYDWPALQPLQVTPLRLDAAALAAMTGEYALRFPGAREPSPAMLVSEEGRLYFDAPPILAHDEVVAISATELISPAWGYRVRFHADGFTLTYGNNVMEATKTKQAP